MRSIACRIFAGFAIWASQISPAGAQHPGDGREIVENVIYRFGERMFADTDDETGQTETIPPADIVSPQPVASGFVGSAFDDSEDDDLLSNAVE
jgi:hypothetical protein